MREIILAILNLFAGRTGIGTTETTNDLTYSINGQDNSNLKIFVLKSECSDLPIYADESSEFPAESELVQAFTNIEGDRKATVEGFGTLVKIRHNLTDASFVELTVERADLQNQLPNLIMQNFI